MRNCAALYLAVLALASFATRAHADQQASAVLMYQQINATTFRYRVYMQDTGTTNIGTLWYAWLPGQDFMGVQPTNLVSPSGWTSSVTHGGANDGYAIQWVNHVFPFSPGQTLNGFGFDSTLSPTDLRGKSPAFPTTDIGTSFTYSGGPELDPGFQFKVLPTTTPWHNPFTATDVNNAAGVNAQDVLLVINRLLAQGSHDLAIPGASDTVPPFVDTNGDNKLTPADVLKVINQLLAAGSSQAVPGSLLASDELAEPLANPAHRFSALGSAVISVPEPASGTLACGAVGVLTMLAIKRWRRPATRNPVS